MGKGQKRRLLAAEVVQTSAMDCGPAALKSLLEGFGIHVSYGRLREACQTDVDGTSIDTLEDVANQLGLEAEQVMIPSDHLFVPEARALPALIVVRLPNGVTHFNVVWRRLGPLVQVMDPAVGRRWTSVRGLLDELYIHQMPVPSDAWREWAASEEFLGPLQRRLTDIGVGSRRRKRLVASALDDPTWRGLGTLDAATRMVSSMVRAGGLSRGRSASRLLRSLVERAEATDQPDEHNDTLIGSAFWSVRPTRAGAEGEQLVLRGAVLVRVAGRRAAGTTGDEPPEQLSPELVAALQEPPARPGRTLLSMLRRDGVLTPMTIVLAVLIAAVGVIFEALVFRGVFEVGRDLVRFEQRLVYMGLLLALAIGLLALEIPISAGLLRLGRHLEVRLRQAFLEKIPRLGDRYFQSRLSSDMAERSHALHVVRVLPQQAGQLLRSTFGLVFTALAIAWIDPASAPFAAAAAIVSVGLPLLLNPLLANRDLRARTHTGALTRFYLDALLGLMPARTHGAERAIRRGHESLLSDWMRAGYSVQRAVVLIEAVLWLTGFALAAVLLFAHVLRDGAGGGVILLVYWALSIPLLGQGVALSVRQYPVLRNVVLRLLEPLGAPEQPRPATPSETAVPAQGGVAVELDQVMVRLAGHTILEDIDLAIQPGEHLAVVGPSGAGKSTLVGLLLGWYRAAQGSVRVGSEPLDEAAIEQLRRQTAWVDPSVQLWNRSLHENLRYGQEDQLQGALTPLIDTADLRRLLESLPEGLQTPLGESGALVSGGEGQRVRFGRALGRPHVRLVILDEPFRGLDRGKRRDLMERARRWWSEATLIAISHDVELTRDFNRVVVIEGGRLVEEGAPDALAAHESSRYARLLCAEEAVHRGLWRGKNWHTLRLENGTLESLPAHPAEPAEADPTPVQTAVGGALREDSEEPSEPAEAEDVLPATWEVANLDSAVAALAHQSGLIEAVPEGTGPVASDVTDNVGAWMEAAAAHFGLEAEPVQARYAEVESMLASAAPALVVVDTLRGRRLLVLVGGSRGRVRLLGPDLAITTRSTADVAALVCGRLNRAVAKSIDSILDSARVRGRRRSRVARALRREQLGALQVEGGWLLRFPPGASFRRQLRGAGILRVVGGLLGAHAMDWALVLVSWWLVGRAALSGSLDIGWLMAWALLLLTVVPLRMLIAWWQGRLALGAGALMKRRLMAGALRFEPDAIRSEGAGQLLGRVIESEAVESLALSGGMYALMAAVELVMAAGVLAVGAAGLVHVLLLTIWTALTVWFGLGYMRRRSRWTSARLDMTHDLVEKMVGHRTRLAQQAPDRWHDGEDRALESYLQSGAGMDGALITLSAIVSRGWLVLGLLGLAAPFLGGASATSLAISVGGLIVARQGFDRLSTGLSSMSGAAIAWGQVAPLFSAAAGAEDETPVMPGLRPHTPAGQPLVEATDLVFRYATRPEPVLRGCSVTIRQGERVLLEGPSGGGKSTLAAVLTGLREPQSGLLLLHGFDRHTLGVQGWRRFVTAVPQFHENHVFTETFAFNLLMGRDWPPAPADMVEAEALCHELGLGPLLERMPAGLLQMVGETGWQLSHGERSRLFLARALLETSDLVVLDETFAALDPENLERALRCALERAPTLLVIAHP